MKLLKHLFFISLLIASTGVLHSQDIHWTQFTLSPLTLNPALTGDFEGTARIGGLYRDQYNFVRGQTSGAKGFRTPSFFVDVPILILRDNDWLSGGVSIDADKAGTGGLTNTRFLASASYHLALDKKATRFLVAGIQYGSVSRKFTDPNDFRFEDQLSNISGTSTDLAKVFQSGGPDNPSNSYSGFNFGLMYRAALNKNTNMNIGTAISYINQPEATIVIDNSESDDAGGPFERPIKITVHGQMDRKINDKLTIYPAFIFQNTNEVSVIAIQAMGGYQLEFKEKELQAKAGLGYRVGDAVQVLLGAHYDDWQIGLAYDLTASSLTSANNLRGGFELAVNKIIKIYKEPVVPPVIFCPDL